MIFQSHRDGALAELRCASELIKREWMVAFPFLTQSRMDLIAYRQNNFVTIQVKSGNVQKARHAVISCKFDMYENVDFIICYDITNLRWFIFPFEELSGRTFITLSPKKYSRFCDNWDLIR